METAINLDHHREIHIHYNYVKVHINEYEKGAISEKCHRFIIGVNKIKLQ